MRFFVTIGAILTLIAGMLLSMPSAHAQVSIYDYAMAADGGSSSSQRSSVSSFSSPYPYFRRTGTSASSSSSSSLRTGMPVFSASSSSSAIRSSSSPAILPPQAPAPEPLSDTPKVGLFLQADPPDAAPGEDVFYRIKIKSLYRGNLPAWRVAFFFDRSELAIIDAGSGKGEGEYITYGVPALRTNAEVTYTVHARVRPGVAPGHSIRTYASMIVDGTISPACSKNDLRVEAPVKYVTTGVGDGTSPVEDLKQFLKPVSQVKKGGWIW